MSGKPVVEILAAWIRKKDQIRGLSVGRSVLKLNQFADDLTCYLADRPSLAALLRVLVSFAKGSGLRVNRNKSKIICPGNSTLSTTTCLEGIPVVKEIKILGIWFTADPSEDCRYKLNFRPILERIKHVCHSWSNRSLSIKGKVTVANALLVSLLQYPTASIHTPLRVLKEYSKILQEFIWDGKRSKIAYKTLILPITQGGLKLIDLDTRIQANMLQWIRRIIRGGGK